MNPPFEAVQGEKQQPAKQDNRDYKDTLRENAGTTGSAPHKEEEADVANFVCERRGQQASWE